MQAELNEKKASSKSRSSDTPTNVGVWFKAEGYTATADDAESPSTEDSDSFSLNGATASDAGISSSNRAGGSE